MDLELSDRVRALLRRFAVLSLRPEGGLSDLDAAGLLVEELFEVIGHEDLGEIAAAAVEAGDLPFVHGVELLGISMWSGHTNGAELSATLERWLDESRDETRAGLALEQSIFPFKDAATMECVLSALQRKFPGLADRCNELIGQRRNQGV